MLSSSCISPVDANKPVRPGSSYAPFGLESPLHMPQEECWPTSSTILDEDDRFLHDFNRLQEDPSSFYSTSGFCVPDMPFFDTLEAVFQQWHPNRLSPSSFQPAESSRTTIAPSLMGCSGDHATFVKNDVKSNDEDALKRNASIDKKKHVYGDPGVVKGQWTPQEDR